MNQLAEQNAIDAWRDCESAGLTHQWERTEVSPQATEKARLMAEVYGYFTCHRGACPAAKFGNR